MAERIAIVGIGESDYSWESGQTETGLAATAVRAALMDAGLVPVDIDGMMRYSFDTAKQTEIARLVGIDDLRLVLDSNSGPASAVSMLATATAAIRAGQARAVVCFRAFNGRSMMRIGHLPLPPTNDEGHILAVGDIPFGGEFTGPYGVLSPACLFPLWVRAYMHRYNISESRMTSALGEIAVRQRGYASNNPRALLRDKPLDADTYRLSPIIAEPLRKADFCLETDGACAYIVAGEEVCRRIKSKPVFVLGTEQSISLEYDNFFLDSPELPPQQDQAMLTRLLDRYDLTHNNIDVLGMYDAVTPNVLFDLESMGFCDYGKATDYIFENKPAINTSGGMLAEVYLQGMNQFLEVVRQLRGDSVNQVAGACLGGVSVALAQGVALLSGEPPV